MTQIPWNKGKKMSAEYCQKLRDAHQGQAGHPISEEARAKIRAARKMQSPPTLGKKFSDESRERMSARQKGILHGCHSEEQKKKLSESLIKTLEKKSPKAHRKMGHDRLITSSEYDQMLSLQGGVCAICGKTDKKRLAIDHNHDSKEVRGLLCQKCNTAIGLLGDDPAIIARAGEYLKKYDTHS